VFAKQDLQLIINDKRHGRTEQNGEYAVHLLVNYKVKKIYNDILSI